MHLFPELYTQRLKLRKITIEDIPSLVKSANNRKIADYILNIPYPYEEPNAVFRISYVVQGFKNKTRFVFAITLKDSDEFIGEISLHLEQNNMAQLAYWIGETFWNQGFASEAIEAVLKFGFENLALTQIYATCHIENQASRKVVQKNGMHQTSLRGKIVQYKLHKSSYEEEHTKQQ